MVLYARGLRLGQLWRANRLAGDGKGLRADVVITAIIMMLWQQGLATTGRVSTAT